MGTGVLGAGALAVFEPLAAGPGGDELAMSRSVLLGATARLDLGASEAAGAVRALAAEAERVTARERAAYPWRRRPAVVRSAWDSALDLAYRELADFHRARLGARSRWRELQAEASTALARARLEAETPGLAASARRSLQEAAIQLDLARRLAAADHHAEAVEAAQTSLAASEGVASAYQELHARFESRAALRLWQTWAGAAVAESSQRQASAVVVDKLRRRLHVYLRGRELGAFPVEIGARGLHAKLHAGDRATPEGLYRVVKRKSGVETRYYKALLLDYPNFTDRRQFREAQRRAAIPPGAGIGGLIEIHGHGGQGGDWTDGCIALTDDAMDRLFALVAEGTPVAIVGTIPPVERPFATRSRAR